MAGVVEDVDHTYFSIREMNMQPEDCCCQAIPIMPSPHIPWYTVVYHWTMRFISDRRIWGKRIGRWIKRRVFHIYIPVELWEIRARRFRILDRAKIKDKETIMAKEDANIFWVISKATPSTLMSGALTKEALEEARRSL